MRVRDVSERVAAVEAREGLLLPQGPGLLVVETRLDEPEVELRDDLRALDEGLRDVLPAEEVVASLDALRRPPEGLAEGWPVLALASEMDIVGGLCDVLLHLVACAGPEVAERALEVGLQREGLRDERLVDAHEEAQVKVPVDEGEGGPAHLEQLEDAPRRRVRDARARLVQGRRKCQLRERVSLASHEVVAELLSLRCLEEAVHGGVREELWTQQTVQIAYALLWGNEPEPRGQVHAEEPELGKDHVLQRQP